MLEDRQESIKKKPNDNLQYHLFVKEFNDLIQAYHSEYDLVAGYSAKFSLHDRCRILNDIKGFPKYLETTVTDFLHPREVGQDAKKMFKHLKKNWDIIY